jgi:hypothetical protein
MLWSKTNLLHLPGIKSRLSSPQPTAISIELYAGMMLLTAMLFDLLLTLVHRYGKPPEHHIYDDKI